MADNTDHTIRNLLTLAVLVIVPAGPVVAFAIAALQHHGVSITTGDFFWDGSIVGFLAFVWFCVALTFPFNILAIWEGVDTDD